jgi:hypothetical protein
MTATLTLWRPTGVRELELVKASGWKAWPPRLPDQPIFYPVLNEQYAIMIARDWNVPASGAGFVTRFEIDAEFAQRYPVQQAGAATSSNCGYPQKNSTSSTDTSSALSKWFTSSTPTRQPRMIHWNRR